MMASGREKREKAGEKLKDIIESLKGPKATKTDIETSNDSASGESDGEFQDSFEQQVSDLEDTINDIPDDSDEIQDLQRLKTECRKVELRRKIEEEKEDLKKLQHPPKANSLTLPTGTEGTNKGEKINDIIACSSEKSGNVCNIAILPKSLCHVET